MHWTALPPLAALRAFAAYAETGSVQKAGAALNVSHAAISQQIRNLESHLGLTLLDRSGRAARLTHEGRQLAEALADGLGTIAARVAELTGADAARPLHVSTTPSFASNWLMPRLAGFRSLHPDIDIMIDPNPALTNPQPGGIDVAIRFGAGRWPGLEAELLLPTSIAVVAATDLIGTHPADCAEDLMRFPWLQELGTSESTAWLRNQGVTEARTAGLVHLPGSLTLEAARQGQGILVTAKEWVLGDIAAGRLRLLFEDPPGKGYHIVTAPGVPRPPLRDFLRWLRRQAPSVSK
ncbi:LysR family transcriptional regulator [Primorskyibacter aestuariivivens]|uniref:LysR family transcriptional regulator n=1 Tax=Primorskyibacter aestuariivivens TaxID=1888912 RepID=UPI002300352B|nr:LysR family transcriptional regulator [Primorskyibacter aestuariivivens]MDA7427368.1 LysR family transcriptional regulator [Primorskyibacter aestuariivivens]